VVGAAPDALYRLLRALAGEGVFTEAAPRTFAQITPRDPMGSGPPGDAIQKITITEE
jgi:hypothetical protein